MKRAGVLSRRAAVTRGKQDLVVTCDARAAAIHLWGVIIGDADEQEIPRRCNTELFLPSPDILRKIYRLYR